ncbi:MAG: GHKL domain-containing protein [bacterium]|nr:GHKL domain-containing protein [bacterium]
MIALYFTLDILVTVVHKWVLTRCTVTSLCREKRGSHAAWLPYTVSTLVTVLSTWIIKQPDLHLIICLLGDIIAVKLSYRDSVYKVMICIFLSQTVSFTVDSMLMAVIGSFMKEPFVMIDGLQFASWQAYLICISLLFLAAFVIRAVLQDFQYKVTLRDFVIILIWYLPVFVLGQSDLVPFLGLNPDWFSPFKLLLTALLGLVFMLALLCVENRFYLREKVMEYKLEIEQRDRQYTYYQKKQADEEKILALYHDMKNHLLLLRENQGPESAKLAESLLAQISDYENYRQTGNAFLDVIIRDKAQRAKECGADFKCSISFEDGDFLQPLDISTVFGNALDNAIEAVEKLPPEERMITVKAGRVQDSLVIVFENTFSGEPVRKTSKSDSFLHGFGIPNIQKAAEKYGGECTVHRDGGRFVLKVLLPIP